ncbi:MAG TPA: cytochrome c biogenesis protein ResB, partial [Anaerolineae bacterium]|nr:cytochrome c biogenesis protein ResB [Anaerolineae bacterium]
MAEERPPAEMSQTEPLSVLWRVFSAPQTLLLLMGLLALTLALGTWVPQVPPQAASDPQAWLATQPGLFGQENALVRVLGLYDLYHTFWFRLLLALTAIVLFVRGVDGIELAWRTTSRRGRAAMLPPWQSSLPGRQIVAALPLAEVRPRVEEHLARRGYRHDQAPGLPVDVLVASHRDVALWARPAGYVALLLALVGLFVTGSWGWQDDPVQLLPGESRSVGHGTPFGFRLDSFRLHLDNRGQLAGYESEITWLEGQAEVRREVAGIGRPARQAGLALHQAGFVPAVRLKAQDGAGQPLRLEGGTMDAGSGDEVLIRFSLPEDQPLVFLPRLDRFVALTFEPRCDLGRPAVHVDL